MQLDCTHLKKTKIMRQALLLVYSIPMGEGNQEDQVTCGRAPCKENKNLAKQQQRIEKIGGSWWTEFREEVNRQYVGLATCITLCKR